VRRAPGIPHALSFQGRNDRQPSGASRRENAVVCTLFDIMNLLADAPALFALVFLYHVFVAIGLPGGRRRLGHASLATVLAAHILFAFKVVLVGHDDSSSEVDAEEEGAFQSEASRFRAKWMPVRVKKTRQDKKLEFRF
jgi:hypothetical protein